MYYINNVLNNNSRTKAKRLDEESDSEEDRSMSTFCIGHSLNVFRGYHAVDGHCARCRQSGQCHASPNVCQSPM